MAAQDHPDWTPFEPYGAPERAALFLAMPRKTLLDLARRGKIPGHPIGEGARKTWKFRISELDHWMQSEVHSAQRLKTCSGRIS